jgi:GNAT superfamily N-acetyltransferase
MMRIEPSRQHLPEVAVTDALRIRPAVPADVPTLHRQLRDFAAFEKLSHAFTIGEAELLRDGFGPTPRFRALIADERGIGVGFLLFYPYYASTFRGISGIFVEDLWVEPSHRGRGVARALFAEVARIARAEGHGALGLSALDWNENARRLYRNLGFAEIEGWVGYRLMGEAFSRLARGE